MGARRGSGARFEAPYTLEVETPHVKWARPLAGGPIRLLAVPSVHEGRTLIELAQRLSLELTTVSIDPAWDVNKWTMAFGSDYGARAEQGDLGLVYSYLEAELTGDKKFDAILLPLNHGWERLSPGTRRGLLRRVYEGAGLVLIRPLGGELAPVAAVPVPANASAPVEPGRAEKSPWRRTADHYITRAIPVESFPFEHIENYVYQATPDAAVLIETECGHPVLAVRPHGKGRVVAFGYRNDGLSWRAPMTARGQFADLYWEYFYALLCRALIYAAGREPVSPPDLNAAGVAWRLKALDGAVKQSGAGAPPAFAHLAPDRYFLEQQAASDWRISAIDVAQPDKIEDPGATPSVITEGDVVHVQWRSNRPARIELVDGLDRVIARSTGENQARLRAGRPLTHSGFVRATVGTALEQHPVRFAAFSREWTDYEVLLPWAGPRGYQPWIGAVDEQFRRIGVTALARAERNFKRMVSAHLPGFGIYWYRRDAYLKRKAGYAGTHDKKYLTRDITLQTPEFEKGLWAQLEKSYRPLAALKPMAVYLADESSLTCYADAFDVDWSGPAMAGFRAWLSREYGSLKALNAAWGTGFRDWNSVVPMTTEEAQKNGHFAPWADHRAYREEEFVQAFRLARKMVHTIDPGGRASISGTQIPTPHNGANWYAIDTASFTTCCAAARPRRGSRRVRSARRCC